MLDLIITVFNNSLLDDLGLAENEILPTQMQVDGSGSTKLQNVLGYDVKLHPVTKAQFSTIEYW